jgi:hypothetical protein
LVDGDSSTDMLRIMNATDGGIGSYIRHALTHATPPRPFTSIRSKIGFGNDRFSHDCAVVRVARGADPAHDLKYVSVVLGSPPARARRDLEKLAVQFHDCITARYPGGPP